MDKLSKNEIQQIREEYEELKRIISSFEKQFYKFGRKTLLLKKLKQRWQFGLSDLEETIRDDSIRNILHDIKQVQSYDK